MDDKARIAYLERQLTDMQADVKRTNSIVEFHHSMWVAGFIMVVIVVALTNLVATGALIAFALVLYLIMLLVHAAVSKRAYPERTKAELEQALLAAKVAMEKSGDSDPS